MGGSHPGSTHQPADARRTRRGEHLTCRTGTCRRRPGASRGGHRPPRPAPRRGGHATPASPGAPTPPACGARHDATGGGGGTAGRTAVPRPRPGRWAGRRGTRPAPGTAAGGVDRGPDRRPGNAAGSTRVDCPPCADPASGGIALRGAHAPGAPAICRGTTPRNTAPTGVRATPGAAPDPASAAAARTPRSSRSGDTPCGPPAGRRAAGSGSGTTSATPARGRRAPDGAAGDPL